MSEQAFRHRSKSFPYFDVRSSNRLTLGHVADQESGRISRIGQSDYVAQAIIDVDATQLVIEFDFHGAHHISDAESELGPKNVIECVELFLRSHGDVSIDGAEVPMPEFYFGDVHYDQPHDKKTAPPVRVEPGDYVEANGVVGQVVEYWRGYGAKLEVVDAAGRISHVRVEPTDIRKITLLDAMAYASSDRSRTADRRLR